MNWIRVAVGIADDPDIHVLAETLGIRVAEAVGLVVSLLTRFPQHASDGDLSNIPATLVERWAGWDGERGACNTAIRALFLTDGKWLAWEKHNGAALRDAEAARVRAAEYRRRNAESLLQSTPNGTANGSPNGTVDRSPLRTNERTNITTGGRKRRELPTATPPPYAEAKPYADAFCPECGDGDPKENEKGRIIGRQHKPGCSHG